MGNEGQISLISEQNLPACHGKSVNGGGLYTIICRKHCENRENCGFRDWHRCI